MILAMTLLLSCQKKDDAQRPPALTTQNASDYFVDYISHQSVVNSVQSTFYFTLKLKNVSELNKVIVYSDNFLTWGIQTTVLALKTTNQTIWIGNGLHCTYWYKFFLNDGRVIETLTKELKR